MKTTKLTPDPIPSTRRCSKSGCVNQIPATMNYKQPFCPLHVDKFLLMRDEVILATIQEAGPEGAPSGIIYAALMGTLPLETYQAMINDLRTLGKIRQSNNVLYAVIGKAAEGRDFKRLPVCGHQGCQLRPGHIPGHTDR